MPLSQNSAWMNSQILYFCILKTMNWIAWVLLTGAFRWATQDQHFRCEVSCLLPGKPVVTCFARSWLCSCYARSQSCEKRLLSSSCLSACLSVRMEQFPSHWTDSYKTLYLSSSRKPVENIQVSLKPDKNDEYFTWRRYDIYESTSLNSS